MASADTLNYGATVCCGSMSIRQHGDAAEQIFVGKNSAENLPHVMNEAATTKQLTTPFGIKVSMQNEPVVSFGVMANRNGVTFVPPQGLCGDKPSQCVHKSD